MSATITLKVVEGPQSGAEFTYRLPTLCTVGRSQDCSLRLPNDVLNSTVSRHHCLLEIDPPLVRVCDLGSLNGTFVNGRKIGQRGKGQTPEEGAKIAFPEVDLKDGDEIADAICFLIANSAVSGELWADAGWHPSA